MGRWINRKRRPGSERLHSGAPAGGHIVVTMRVHEEDGYFVGEAVELGISSFGETSDEALEMTMDAVCTHLNALEDLGKARDFLASHGLSVHEPHEASTEEDPVSVTLHPGEIVSSRLVPVS